MVRTLSKRVWPLVLTLVAACGGGGGGSEDSALDFTGVSVGPGAQPKTLDFGWSTDGDEPVDHYRLEFNPDGASGFTTVSGGDNVTGTRFTLTEPVHLTDWVNAEYRVVALDGSNDELASSSSIGLLNNVTAEAVTGYFKASNTEADDAFGEGVALSDNGETLVVGAPLEDSVRGDPDGNNKDESGAVYVFTCSGGTWGQQAFLKASNSDDGDGFGESMALSDDGQTLAVAAPVEASATMGVNNGGQGDNSEFRAGAVYVFTYDSTWSQQAYVKASNTTGDYRFGTTVALSDVGDTLAV